MPYEEDIPTFLKLTPEERALIQASIEPKSESDVELVDEQVCYFDISLQFLGDGLDAVESVLSRSQIKHLASIKIQTSRDWQRRPEVDLRLVFVDGSDAETLAHLKHEPPLESDTEKFNPLTILVLINADKAKPEQLPVSRQCIVDTQIHLNGSEKAIHRQVDQFYRFLLSAAGLQPSLICIDWADIRCVLLLSRRLEFRSVCPSEVESLIQAAGVLIGEFTHQELQQAKSLLFYDHSAEALEGGRGRSMEDFELAMDLIDKSVNEDCTSLSSLGIQMPEYGTGIVGLLLGVPKNLII